MLLACVPGFLAALKMFPLAGIKENRQTGSRFSCLEREKRERPTTSGSGVPAWKRALPMELAVIPHWPITCDIPAGNPEGGCDESGP